MWWVKTSDVFMMSDEFAGVLRVAFSRRQTDEIHGNRKNKEKVVSNAQQIETCENHANRLGQESMKSRTCKAFPAVSQIHGHGRERFRADLQIGKNKPKIVAATTKACRGHNAMTEVFVCKKYKNLIQNSIKVCPGHNEMGHGQSPTAWHSPLLENCQSPPISIQIPPKFVPLSPFSPAGVARRQSHLQAHPFYFQNN